MKENSLIKYKENFFKRMINFIFSKSKTHKDESFKQNSSTFENEKMYFDNTIKVDDLIQEKNELLNLKILYDSGKISDKNLDISSIYKLIELYKSETQKIKEDTRQRINNIKINMHYS